VAHWYGEAAERGHATAMTSLGDLYERGQGVALDRDQALTLYRRALAAGNTAAAAGIERLDPALPA
jgi:uncharacterized protein